MHKRTAIVLTLVAALAFTGALMTSTTASHDQRLDERIVHPYNQQVWWHEPIVVGYQVMPPPLMCTGGAADILTSYEEDFEDGMNGWEFVGTPLSSASFDPGSWGYSNLWTLTDYPGTRGTDVGYDERNRLYFGLTSGFQAGTYNSGHSAGTAQSPEIELPPGPSVLTYATKWETEYLIGYDHMFVELLDQDGNIHLLCHNNSEGRADEAGVNGQSDYQSCSPFLSNPCPTYANSQLHSEFPAWENRQVAIPPTLWGQEVQVRFTFDTSDGAANWFHGWSVTDVAIGTPTGVGL